jgi:hypothetical protein
MPGKVLAQEKRLSIFSNLKNSGYIDHRQVKTRIITNSPGMPDHSMGDYIPYSKAL